MLKVIGKEFQSQFKDEKINALLSKVLSYWADRMGFKEENVLIDILSDRDISKFTSDLYSLSEEGIENNADAMKIAKRMLILPIYSKYLEIYAGEKNDKRELRGIGTMPIFSEQQLGIVYSPGVGYVSKYLHRTPNSFNDFCRNKRYSYYYNSDKKVLEAPSVMYEEQRDDMNMFTITDGSATLGIGNVDESSIPVMFGKTVLLESFGGKSVKSDVCYVDTKKFWKEAKSGNWDEGLKKIVDACVHAVELIVKEHPTAMIMLEDIAAPVCFDIEDTLNEKGIFTIHDDQWGTATIFSAGVYKAIELSGRKPEEIKKVVISGAGASAAAVSRTINTLGVKNIILFDSRGSLHKGRKNLPISKQRLLSMNVDDFSGTIEEALEGADGFIGLSQPGLFKGREIEMLSKMNKGAFVFAGANPDPEFDMFTMNKEMKPNGKLTNISYIGCGAFGNPGTILNNSSVFPGLYRALTDAYAEKKLKHTKDVSNAEIAVYSAIGLASAVEEEDIKNGSIVPKTFTRNTGYNFKVTQAVATKVWTLATGESDEKAKKKYENLAEELMESQIENMKKYEDISKELKIFLNGAVELMGEDEYPIMKELKKHITV